jgi:hypothetical protein
MPKTSKRRETNRPAPYKPYNLRTSIAPTPTMAVVQSPVHTPFTPHHMQQMWPDPSQSMGYQPQPMLPTYMPQMHHLPPQQRQQQQQLQQHPGQSAPWTAEEDNRLLDAKIAGLGWGEIHERYFPNKSGNACRKRHERLMMKVRTTDWSPDRIRRVMAEYNAPGVKEEFWSRIAARCGERRWEDVEKVVSRVVNAPKSQV